LSSNLEDSIFEEDPVGFHAQMQREYDKDLDSPEEFDNTPVLYGYHNMRKVLSIKQVDHWTRNGWLELSERKDWMGSGFPRHWTEDAMKTAILMKRLVNFGFMAEKAHELAQLVLADMREYPEQKWVQLGPLRGHFQIRMDIQEEWDGRLEWIQP
jgi:hypothetical protein